VNRKRLSVCIALLFVLTTAVSSQDPEGPFRVDTQIVSLSVAVRDNRGKPVKGLAVSQFQVFDNGVLQKIEHFSNADSGVAFGVVYDLHPTTDDNTRAVLLSLRQFTKNLLAQDDFFFVAFNEHGSLVADIVPDLEQMNRHLADPGKREPRSLYDALFLATQKLRTKPSMKRTLLVITDTADHSSRCSLTELHRELRKLDMRVYAIVPDRNLERSQAIDLNPEQDARLWTDATPAERSAMNSVTLRSGGGTFPASLRREGSVVRILDQISAEIRDQYTLGFYPSGVPDGKWHDLKIRLDAGRTGKDFVLTYRSGYQSSLPGK
jgi:Ca-activated chloride channel homolog